jgi:ADP-heptose:LPS heptosyltransferase
VAFESANKGPLRKLVYQNFVHVAVHSVHTVEQMLELLRPLGVPPPKAEVLPVLTVPNIAARRVQILLRECGVNGDFALLHPGTASTEKYWLPERWAEVILHLQRQHKLPCVLTGGPDAEEQSHLREIRTALAMLGDGPLPEPFVILAGQLDLTLLTALTAQCRIAICCDTAVMHMASAFRRPQVSLFGPTNPFEWRPRHPNSLVVTAQIPNGVTESFSPDATGAPMTEIPSSTVCKAVNTLMRTEKQ